MKGRNEGRKEQESTTERNEGMRRRWRKEEVAQQEGRRKEE